jgi:hypothetical protein
MSDEHDPPDPDSGFLLPEDDEPMSQAGPGLPEADTAGEPPAPSEVSTFTGILPEPRIEPGPSVIPAGAPAEDSDAALVEPAPLADSPSSDSPAPPPLGPSGRRVEGPAPGVSGVPGRSRREERDRPRAPRGPRPDLLASAEPLYRDRGGYRMRLEPADLARLRELPGSKGKTDRELGETFFDGQSERFVTSLAEDVPAPAEVRVVVDPYSRQAFLAVEQKIRSILSF